MVDWRWMELAQDRIQWRTNDAGKCLFYLFVCYSVCSLTDSSNSVFVPALDAFPTEALCVPKLCTHFCGFRRVTAELSSLVCC
jgi:hypothetical protein